MTINSVVLDICCLVEPPIYKRIMLMSACQRAGVEVHIRSYLGRSTTRKFLREINLLPYVDDFLWNDAALPEGAVEITDPEDRIFEIIHAAGLARARTWLTPALSSTQEFHLPHEEASNGR